MNLLSESGAAMSEESSEAPAAGEHLEAMKLLSVKVAMCRCPASCVERQNNSPPGGTSTESRDSDPSS